MQYTQSITPMQVRPTLQEMTTWPLALRHLHLHLAACFARPEPRQHALLYLHAILSDIPRKNGWQIAEYARLLHPYGIQRLLSRAVWDEDGVRDAVRCLVVSTLLPPSAASADPQCVFPVMVLDESGFPKRGKHSAGVAPQYCGRTGRVENCQVGVFASYVTPLGHALIDRELYLPEDWCTDLPRRQAAHIPDTVTFATKPELAQRLLARAHAAGVPIKWVVADTVYGHAPTLRTFLEERGLSHALAVPSTEVVCVYTPSGPLLDTVGSIAQRALRPQDWQRLSQSLGTKGERCFDWAILPLVHQGEVDGRHWLVFRRCLDDPDELAYYLVWAPLGTSLSTIVQAIGARWHVEEDLEVNKGLGLGHYEGRSYLGWYRHITLVLLAAAFLLHLCVQANTPLPVSVPSLPPPSPPPVPPVPPPAPASTLTPLLLPAPACSSSAAARSLLLPKPIALPLPPAVCPLIPLTCSEAQHLFARLCQPPPPSAALVYHWSQWRRTHQYWARVFHRRRRATALSPPLTG
jgi:SRSO17 transposase